MQSPLGAKDEDPSTMTSTRELASFIRTTGPEESKDEHNDVSHILPPVRRASKHVPIVVPSSAGQPIQRASSPLSSMKVSTDDSTVGLLNPAQRQEQKEQKEQKEQEEQEENDEFEADVNEILYGKRIVAGKKMQNLDGEPQSESLVDFLRNTGPEDSNPAPSSNPKRWGTLGKRVKSVPARSFSTPYSNSKSQPLVQAIADIDLDSTTPTTPTKPKIRVKGINDHVTQLSYSPKKKSPGSPGSTTTSEFSSGSRKLSTSSRSKRRGPTSETTSLAEFLRNTSPEDFHKPTQPNPANETTRSTFTTGARRRAAYVRRNIMRRISSAPTKTNSAPPPQQAPQPDPASLSMATGGVPRQPTHIPLVAAASTTQVQ